MPAESPPVPQQATQQISQPAHRDAASGSWFQTSASPLEANFVSQESVGANRFAAALYSLRSPSQPLGRLGHSGDDRFCKTANLPFAEPAAGTRIPNCAVETARGQLLRSPSTEGRRSFERTAAGLRPRIFPLMTYPPKRLDLSRSRGRHGQGRLSFADAKSGFQRYAPNLPFLLLTTP